MQRAFIFDLDGILINNEPTAKASGAYVIGLRQNLVEGYKQVGANRYAETVEDVITFISK